MKRLLFLLLLVTFHTTLVAQKARVFEHFSTGFAFGDNALVPSISYTQTLALGKKFGFRVNTGLRYTQYVLKSPIELSNITPNKPSTLTLTKNMGNTAINIPVGIEVGNRLFAIGINADVVGFTLAKSRDQSTFAVNNGMPPQELSLVPQGFNFLITQNGTLNSQAYVSATPNQNLTIKVGMAFTQTHFNTTYPDPEDTENSLSWDSFVEHAFRPFIGLQFNFEK